MKRSEAYQLAQLAGLLANTIAPENKLEVLKTLMEAETLALFAEEQEQAVNE